MMGFGAVLHVLNGNAKEVKQSLEKLGEAHPAIAKITGALSRLMDKFGIGSNAIRKLSTVIAMFGGGMIVLPALATAYVGLASIWQWPYADEVAKTTAVICTLLGALLGISTAQYNKQEPPDVE